MPQENDLDGNDILDMDDNCPRTFNSEQIDEDKMGRMMSVKSRHVTKQTELLSILLVTFYSWVRV